MVDLGPPCQLWSESFSPINYRLMFGVLWNVNYGLSWFLFVIFVINTTRGGMGGIYLSRSHSPPFRSLCLRLSQHDMVWKLPICLLMMINVHSHVSNLGSSWRVAEMVTKGDLRRELIVQSSVLLLSELDASSISPSSLQHLGDPSWVFGTRSWVGADGRAPTWRA